MAGVDVLGFHQLCVALAEEAGVPLPGGRRDRAFYDRVLPGARAEGEELVCRGPEGPPVETVEVREEDLRGELSRRLHRLVIEEGVSPRDLVVLTPHAADRSRVRGRVGAFPLTRDPVGGHDVRLESIHRFKGLDARAVILCEVDRYVGEDFLRLMYVGCSRARTLLVVLLTAREAPGGRAAG